jgi:hypothetical protein
MPKTLADSDSETLADSDNETLICSDNENLLMWMLAKAEDLLDDIVRRTNTKRTTLYILPPIILHTSRIPFNRDSTSAESYPNSSANDQIRHDRLSDEDENSFLLKRTNTTALLTTRNRTSIRILRRKKR